MPLPEMKSVYSSNVDTIGYDNGDLYVQWTTGRVSVYHGVPASVASDVAGSWSVGKALREQVKERYSHEYFQGE